METFPFKMESFVPFVFRMMTNSKLKIKNSKLFTPCPPFKKEDYHGLYLMIQTSCLPAPLELVCPPKT